MIHDQFRLAIEQFAPRLRARVQNLEHMVRGAVGADLLLTPELSLTGYDVGDAAHHLALPLEPGEPFPLDGAHTDSAVVIGMIERGRDGVPYNSSTLVRRGRVLHRHRKIYLPTYGMFDEARFFGSSDVLEPFDLDGWRIGMLVCEDFWHPGLVYVLATAGIDVLLVQAAGPGRGVWDAEDDAVPFTNMESWTDIARTTAMLYGIYVALANRSGVEGAVTFGGSSIIVAPDGSVLARAGVDDARIEAVLQRADLLAARRPGAHIRDEDPRIVRRALDRLTPG